MRDALGRIRFRHANAKEGLICRLGRGGKAVLCMDALASGWRGPIPFRAV